MIQVALSFVAAVWIFWFLYKDIKMESLTQALDQASLSWIFLSVIISVWGYWVRAWRWKLLIEGDETNALGVWRAFWALMTGYLANLFVPRAGEIARCGVLSKTDQLPVGMLLGTVIMERAIDLFLLILIVFLTFLMEYGVFISLLESVFSMEALTASVLKYLPILAAMALVMGILVYWAAKKYRDKGIMKKIRHFLRDFLKGLSNVKKVRNRWGLWSSSVMIWIIYYLMMYFIALAIPTTASLHPSSLLMVMVMGSIGMIAPVQGGIGTFHALVAFILTFYGLTGEEGKIFAVIIHSTQLLTVVILGVVSLVVFLKLSRKGEPIGKHLR